MVKQNEEQEKESKAAGKEKIGWLKNEIQKEQEFKNIKLRWF